MHAAYLQGVTGGQDPCGWATWLYNPAHCAQAALAIYKGSGLSAWTTYNDGRWAQHIAQAKQAVSAATQAAAVSPQSLPSGGGSFSANHAILWLTAAGVGLSVVSTYEGYQRIVQKHGHSAPLGLGR